MITSKFGLIFKKIFGFFKTRVVLFGFLSIFIALYTMHLSTMIQTVYIIDGDNSSVSYTTKNNVDNILAEYTSTLSALDSVFKEDNNLFSMLTVKRGFQVTLSVDGKSKTYTTNQSPFTVNDLLTMAHVERDEDDYCDYSYAHELMDGDCVNFIHTTKNRVELFEDIPFETEYKSTSLIRSGKTKTLVDGELGSRKCTYDEYVDNNGNVISSELISSEIVLEPVNELILQGDGSPISRLDWSDDFPIGDDNIPEDYITVFRSRKATGYYFTEGCWGSSGGYCYAGTAAVQLDMFPYGTKLWVVSSNPDSEFVYGYTISNDTGGLEYIDITLDLFYETYAESALNGLKYVDIYVLEWGDGNVVEN